VPSLAVVKYFYVPKDVPTGFFPGFVFIVIKHFALYGAKKGFRTSIVIAVALAAHAANHLIVLE
jgi:hypothetical protein